MKEPMMTHPIRKVAVLGAGTMGGGIAAHCANAGLHVVLLDVAPTTLTPEEQAKGLTLESKAVRNRIVNAGFDRVKKSRPAALFTPERANLITIGNLTDDLGLIADADWIVEAIVEQLEPKRALMERVEAQRKPGSIVSSNTSGIPIAAIAEGRSEDFRKHFLGTHFFNPPRYLYLLEIIPTPDTQPEVIDTFSQFADLALGKGVVIAKDRPNFIANRIGTYAGQTRMLYALEHGYTVEEVDSLTGELIGNPKTATFRLADLVGNDVMAHVTRNLYEAVPEDEEHATYKLPAALEQMLEQGWLGNKAGAGFYKETRGASGKEFWPLNLKTMQHEAPTKVRFELVGKARKIDDLRERLRFLMDNAEMDRAGQYLRATTLRILAYTARRIPEISDSIADVDRAMRWGFSQQLGPFETWDSLGVRKTVEVMQQHDIEVAPWVLNMLVRGHDSFYQYDNKRVVGVYDVNRHAYVPLPPREGVIVLDDLRAQGKEVARNESASLIDLGDGVLCLEFHSKMNAFDPLIEAMGRQALTMLERDEWAGMVIGNQSTDFCIGANLALAAMGVASGQIDQLKETARSTQSLFLQFRLYPKPIVAAPYGRVLGGGVEVALSAARCVAGAETYMGLVELGVGLVPGWGGCKEFVRRRLGRAMRTPHVDPLPFFQQAFETIAMAKVGESAEQSKQLGYLDEHDKIVMNKERLIAEAKKTVLELVGSGYTPPAPGGEPIYAIGRRGIAAVGSNVHQMRVGGYISAYDQRLANALAWVMSGGDLSSPQWVTEQYILDLEMEQTMQLIVEPKTQERIMTMLQSGKPLRN
jgi:3-hydroxyacyl-CoA dehydrogenase